VSVRRLDTHLVFESASAELCSVLVRNSVEVEA
jgi:hypothetical protein